MSDWPIGTSLAAPTIEPRRCDAEAVAMLKRANVLVASAALCIPHDATRANAVQFVKESTALVRRLEGRK